MKFLPNNQKLPLKYEALAMAVALLIAVWVGWSVLNTPITLQSTNCLDCEPPINLWSVGFLLVVALITGIVISIVTYTSEGSEGNGGRKTRVK